MTGLALYEIADQYLDALRDLAELDLDEQTIADTLEGLSGDLETKAINVAAFFQNLDAQADAIRAAEKRMAERRQSIEKRTARLKEYLRTQMERTGIKEIACPHYVLRLRLNPEAVVVDDEATLPAEFVRVKEVRNPDKTAIKDALKSGKPVPGAHLERGTRLEIK